MHLAEQGAMLSRQAREGLADYERSLVVAALASSRRQRMEQPTSPAALESKLQHLERICRTMSEAIAGLSHELQERFEAHDRELTKALNKTTLKQHLAEYERDIIQIALRRCGMNQVAAARLLGLNPTTLSEKMKRLGLRGTEHLPR
jgi:DNA-binding NtrC family response regulator